MVLFADLGSRNLPAQEIQFDLDAGRVELFGVADEVLEVSGPRVIRIRLTLAEPPRD